VVAVIWDCDGVLVDSEPHSIAAWMAVLPRYGSPAVAADVEACTGLGFLPTFDHLSALGSSRPFPAPEELWPELLDALAVSFEGGLRVFADSASTIRGVAAAGLLQGVATTSPRSRLELTLRSAGLGGNFAATAAGDEVVAGKPAPDVYLLAAERLEVDPRTCVAVEDTGFGVRAAVAAGMRTIGIVRDPSQEQAMAEAGAEIVTVIEPRLLVG
jgi:beta-phosphoglucomutase-like phosphatase (HAD superfamily)